MKKEYPDSWMLPFGLTLAGLFLGSFALDFIMRIVGLLIFGERKLSGGQEIISYIVVGLLVILILVLVIYRQKQKEKKKDHDRN